MCILLSIAELGRDALVAEGYHVLGGYMSPFNDLCHKKVPLSSFLRSLASLRSNSQV